MFARNGKLIAFIAVVLCIMVTAIVLPPRKQILNNPFQHEQGFAWTMSLPKHFWFADNIRPDASPLRLFENNQELTQSHCLHDTIRRKGEGCFSHWGGSLYFSTTDNTDPNNNKRTYHVSYAYGDLFHGSTLVYLFVVSVLAGMIVAPLIVARSSGSAWLTVIACSGAVIIVILYLNLVNIHSYWGRSFYALFALIPFIFAILTAFVAFRGRKPKSFERFALFWLYLAASVLSLESFARSMPIYDSMGDNPGVKFFWPEWVNMPLNNFGHRDRDFLTTKSANTFRILMLGDSFTEGAGLSRDQTFSRKLEKKLNNTLMGENRHVEVYNLGHSGLNTHEEVELLKQQGDELKPDMVILNYFLNDAETHPLTYKFYETPSWVTQYHNMFNKNFGSYAYYLAYKNITIFQGKFDSISDLFKMQHRPNSPGWLAIKNAAKDFGEFVYTKDIIGAVAVWPLFLNDPYELLEIHDQVNDTMSGNGIAVLDLYSLFSNTNKKMDHWTLSQYDLHPNALANNLVAQTYAEHIQSLSAYKSWRLGVQK